jgi:dCTP deaminase
VTGIEPALSAWEADVLPLNYTRAGTPGHPSLPVGTLPITQQQAPEASETAAEASPDRVGLVLLSDGDIRKEIASGRISLEPWDPEMVQPSSVDVRIDRYFRVFENHRYPHIDPAEEQPDLTRLVETPGDEPFILHPGEFVLASTYEVVTLPADVSARLEGKSSIGRLGLLTHSTAGFIDAGFSGHVTLELSNVATLPIKLWPGMKIGQLCFFRLTSPAEQPYGSGASGSRYQGQRGPTPSKSYLNFSRTKI